MDRQDYINLVRMLKQYHETAPTGIRRNLDRMIFMIKSEEKITEQDLKMR